MRNKTIQQHANAIARKRGYGRATKIIYDPSAPAEVVRHVRYGYRKITTDEYVPSSYRANFGWKNTYYQSAETVANLPLRNIVQD